MRKGILLVVFSFLLVKSRAVDPLCAGLPLDVEELFPSPLRCEEYYKCFNGTLTVETCPTGLVFSDKLKDCVPPEYSECTGGTGTPFTTSSTLPPSTPSAAPSTTTTDVTTSTPDDVDPRCIGNETSYWPHPSDCSKYIECYKGDSFEMKCPPGTYFSDNRKKCGNANESECCLNNLSVCS